MDRPSSHTPADPESAYGAKCARLLELSAHPRFTSVALPVFPLSDRVAREFLDDVLNAGDETDGASQRDNAAELITGYAEFLRNRWPGLSDDIVAACGPAPWIVRSSGAEDQADNINAGGYDSLVCAGPADLPGIVAAVAFSGYGEHAVAQQRLTDPDFRPGPIPAFVQPLVDASASGPPPAPQETPLLDRTETEHVAHLLAALHDHFGMPRLDCEWVLETDAGTVSVTSLTEREKEGVVGQLSLGFGFASAQRLDGTDNSVVWLSGDGATPLWRGELLRAIRVRAARLVQVRPAVAFDPAPTVRVLTDEDRVSWEDSHPGRPVDLLVPPRRVAATAFLATARLDDAWAQYLRLDAEQRAATGHVLVERGSPAEHAAVMFRQYGVAVLRCRAEDVPESASYVLADPWAERCYFGAGHPPRVRTVPRRVAAVPSGCRLLFDERSCATAAADLADGRRPEPAAMPGYEELRTAAHLSPMARERLVTRSFLPDPDCHLRDGDAVASPAFVARAAGAALALGADPARVVSAVPDEAAGYVRGLVAARVPGHVTGVLPRCARLLGAGSLGAATGRPDARLGVVLARIDGRDGISDTVLLRLLPPVLALADSAVGADAALDLLLAAESLADAMDALDVHADGERDDLLVRLLNALPLKDPVTAGELCRLARRSALPPGETARLVAAASADPEFAARQMELERCRVALSAADPAAAPQRARELAAAYRAYARGTLLEDEVLLDLVRCDLIETYDATLKNLLLKLVDRPELVVHQGYLGVMLGWLELAEAFGPTHREARAVEVFRRWVAQWQAGPPAEDHTIEENASWQRVLEDAADAATPPPPPANPHRLHNALHQWLLATTRRYPAERAPSGVAELHEVADRFCRGGNKLLRLTRESFELDVPLSLHKASLLFTPGRIEAEWSEQPDVTEEETGRLAAFEVLLARFGDWFPDVALRSERLLAAGTWTLRIEARPAGRAERFGLPRMRLVLGLLRTLFDGSYDFSYVPVKEVAHLEEAFASPRWAAVFSSLVDYRAQYDDSAQYETLETMPLALSMSMLCTDTWTRETVLRLVDAGPGAAVEELDALVGELREETDPAAWTTVFHRIQQTALVLAARHPRAALGALAARPTAGWADILATAALPRADLRAPLRAALRRGRPDDPLTALVLRHAPHLVVTAADAADLARAALRAPKAYRRRKQYLAHRHAAALETAGVLGPLVADLEVVPYGCDAGAEAALSRAVTAVGGRLRCDIRSKIDETHPVFLGGPAHAVPAP
ncbi:hypothetical protein GCM10010433_21870 [Streptomyces pulveraceus]|uniref:Uncharacterized protein n=1 Tax=Streptomyces pulveraceus TaxID=68258 RepID=A0ABW1GY08_9ACTN